MFLANSGAHTNGAPDSLFADTFEVTPRLRLRRKKRPAPALAALGLGSALAFGAAEAAAKTKTIMQNGDSYFNVGELNASQLANGAMEITFDKRPKRSLFQQVNTATPQATCLSPKSTCRTSWPTPS